MHNPLEKIVIHNKIQKKVKSINIQMIFMIQINQILIIKQFKLIIMFTIYNKKFKQFKQIIINKIYNKKQML